VKLGYIFLYTRIHSTEVSLTLKKADGMPEVAILPNEVWCIEPATIDGQAVRYCSGSRRRGDEVEESHESSVTNRLNFSRV
jgi:hypothetical protein